MTGRPARTGHAPSRPLLVGLALFLALASVWPDKFSFSADNMTGSMVKGRERVVLTGQAVVRSDALGITANRIELYGDDFRFAQASGAVRVEDLERGFVLTTENLFYDRQDRISRLTGPSVMEDRRNAVVIKGSFIENDDKRETALVQINVRILKENLACRAEFARYDRKANTLELTGSPYVRRDGDEYRAALIQVNMNTDNILLQGSVSGAVSSSATPASPAPATPAPGTP